MKSPVRGLLGLVSFILVVGGIGGLLGEWVGWFHLFGFMRYLVVEGYEVYSYAVMIVLGIAVGMASEAGRRGGAGK
ncbi:hypothetical protein [Streptomyces sp. NPDC003077]|uniref:hypothetical protein n=1 Tax=Streptomyces sp. NPDC003077 TaxID=3154443 RepID=UPI0033B796C0